MDDLLFKIYFLLGSPHELLKIKLESCEFRGAKLEFISDAPSLDAIQDAIKNSCDIIVTDEVGIIEKLKSDDLCSPRLVYVGDGSDIVELNLDICDSNYAGLIPAPKSYPEQELVFKHILNYLVYRFKALQYQNFLETMIDGMPELVWFKNAEGAHMLVNTKFCKTVNKTKEQIRGRGHYYIWDISPDEYAKGEFVCMESETEVMEKRHTCVFEEPVLTKEGMKHFMTYKTPLSKPNGDLWGTVGIAYDLSDYSNLGIEMSYVFETLPYPIVVCGADGTASFINTRFKRAFGIENLTGFDYAEWLENTFNIDITEKRRQNEDEGRTLKINSLIYGSHGSAHGSERHYRLTERAIRDYFGNIAGFYSLFDDITAEELYNQKIQDLANKDPLTGLYNRRYFVEYLKENFGEEQTIIFYDLDYFKSINDNFGHAEGDKTLRVLASLMGEVFPDSLRARIGGDEFAVVYLGSTEDAETHMVDLEEKYLSYLSENQKLGGISRGIVRRRAGQDLDEIMHQADMLMYRQKDEHHSHFRSVLKNSF